MRLALHRRAHLNGSRLALVAFSVIILTLALSGAALAADDLPTPAVTLPNTAGPFAQGSVVSVAWGVASPASTGWFHTYAYRDGSYYWLNSQAASGASSYGFDWTVTQPTGTDVWSGSGTWTAAATGWSRATPALASRSRPVPCPPPPSPYLIPPVPLPRDRWCRWPGCR